MQVAMWNEYVGQQWLAERSREARLRAGQAQDAAERARKRIAELHKRERLGPIGPAEAEERRLLAEERLARVEAALAEARQRSVNAHERAARLDDWTGRLTEAERHYAAADDERQVIEDEAVLVARRREQQQKEQEQGA